MIPLAYGGYIIVYVVVWWCCYHQDPYELLSWWNGVISSKCQAMKIRLADTFEQEDIRIMHMSISSCHNQILEEAKILLDSGGGVPMVEMDIVQSSFFMQDGWRPLWVKFLNGYAPGSDKMPTLKKIVSETPGIVLAHISVLHPNTVLSPHRGISKSVYRYHYGLDIPSNGNIGLQVGQELYRWKNREGIVWDDTEMHSAWNMSDKPRLVIFIDIKRDLGPVYNLATSIIYKIVSVSKTVEESCGVLRDYEKRSLTP